MWFAEKKSLGWFNSNGHETPSHASILNVRECAIPKDQNIHHNAIASYEVTLEYVTNMQDGIPITSLQWRHNRRDSVSNHQPHDCLFNRLFRRRSKKASKLRVTGLCAGNSPGTGEFPAQMASNAENVSIWWRHRDCGVALECIVWVTLKP